MWDDSRISLFDVVLLHAANTEQPLSIDPAGLQGLARAYVPTNEALRVSDRESLANRLLQDVAMRIPKCTAPASANSSRSTTWSPEHRSCRGEEADNPRLIRRSPAS